jgi:hypothetical protein
MAVTPQEAIATLEAALAGGVLEVTYSDGRKVRYQTTEDMQKAIAYFTGQARLAAGRPAVSASVGAFYRD